MPNDVRRMTSVLLYKLLTTFLLNCKFTTLRSSLYPRTNRYKRSSIHFPEILLRKLIPKKFLYGYQAPLSGTTIRAYSNFKYIYSLENKLHVRKQLSAVRIVFNKMIKMMNYVIKWTEFSNKFAKI